MAMDVTRRGFLGAAGAALAAGAVSAQAADSAHGIKIVGLSCSYRKGKTTAAAVQFVLESAKTVSPEIETEFIDLAGLKLNPALAAGIPLEPGQTDDFPAIQSKLADPKVAGIIIGTPIYFGNMSSLCKAFLERCMAFRRDFVLRNKVAGCVAVGGSRNGGQELTLQSIRASLAAQDMLVVGDGRPTAHLGATIWNNAKDDITKDEAGLATARNLGRRVAELALRMSGAA